MNTFMIVSNVLLWCVLIIQMILFFVVTRSVSELVKRFQVTQPGSGVNDTKIVLGQHAPLFSEQDHRGEIITLRRGASHRTLLVFTLDTCVACEKLIPELPKLLVDEPLLRIIVVAQEDLSARDKQVPSGISLVRCNWLMEQYDVKQTPYYVLIDSDGRIADKGAAITINSLLDKTA